MCESWYTPKSEQRYQWKVLAVVLFLHRVLVSLVSGRERSDSAYERMTIHDVIGKTLI